MKDNATDEEPLCIDHDKFFRGEINMVETERGITKLVTENKESVMLAREQGGDARSVDGDKIDFGDTAPSVISVNKDVKKPVDKCRLRGEKWCVVHDCEASVIKTSKKEWAWLESKKLFGYKYRKVRTIICKGKGLVRDEPVISEPDCSEAEGDNWPGRRLAMRNYSLRVRVQAESNLE